MSTSTVALTAVTFDLDGTLIDLERFHHEAHLRAARLAGVDLTRDEALRRLPHFIGGPDASVAAEIAALAASEIPSEEIHAAKRRYFSALIDAEDRIVPRAGVGTILDRLRSRGIPLAVGTVTEREEALGILCRAGLLPYFDDGRVVGAEDVPRLKPNPDIYQATAALLGTDPAGQLVFEDSLTGIKAARAAGSPVVAMPTFPDPGYLRAIGINGAMAAFPDWADPRLIPLLDRLVGGGVLADVDGGAGTLTGAAHGSGRP